LDALTAVLGILVVISILFEIAPPVGRAVSDPVRARRPGTGVRARPAPIALQPNLVLLVFLPPLLFSAAVETPIRDLRANLAPLARLSVGLVIFTMVRDRGEINDQTLRLVERELDLEELRMEG